jgi:PleD family two-component response regulator
MTLGRLIPSRRRAGLAVFEERLVETALESQDRRVPDVIMLDVGIPPEINGVAMLARLREDHRWKRLPVIVLSGFGDHLNADIVTRLGVRVVLTKAEASMSGKSSLTGELGTFTMPVAQLYIVDTIETLPPRIPRGGRRLMLGSPRPGTDGSASYKLFHNHDG